MTSKNLKPKNKTKSQKHLRSKSANPSDKDDEIKVDFSNLRTYDKPKKHDSTKQKAINIKTPSYKEKELRKENDTLRKRLNDRDSTIKSLKTKTGELQREIKNLENVLKEKNRKLQGETKMRLNANKDRLDIKNRLRKMQNAVAARLKLLGIDLSSCATIGEALDASLNAITKLVMELQKKEKENKELSDLNEKLKWQNDQLKERLKERESKDEEYEKQIKKLNRKLKEAEEQIKRESNSNSQLQRKKEQLMIDLQEWKDKFNDLTKKSQQEVKQLNNKVKDKETVIHSRDNEIEKLKEQIKKLENKSEAQKQTIDNRDKEIKKLNEIIKERDETIVGKNNEIEDKEREIERLLAIINKPKANKEVQTDITGDINEAVEKYPNLKNKVDELQKLLDGVNDRIEKLEEENEQLLKDIDELIKAACRFYTDPSNHGGEVFHMIAHPTRYLTATCAMDKTIRFWKLDPSNETKRKQCQPYMRANIDAKVDCLAFSKDGSMLAGGSGFHDGPDGFLIIWDCRQGNEGVVLHAFRSRPTIRFGRVSACAFHNNNKFIFAGDTTGSIWIFDIEKHKLIGCVAHHSDVVTGLDIYQNYLYSSGHDRKLYRIDVNKIKYDVKDDHSTGLTETLKIMMNTKHQKGSKSSSKIFNKNRVSTPKGSRTPKGSKSPKKNRWSIKSNKSNKRSKTRSKNSLFPTEDLLKEDDSDFSCEIIAGIRHYTGELLQSDDKYPLWCCNVTSNGEFVLSGSRKVFIFKIDRNENNKVTAHEKRLEDSDNDHVKTIDTKGGMLLVARKGCPRSKLFNLRNGGKELKIIKSEKKAGFVGAKFCNDNKHIVYAYQLLIPNEAPKAFYMRLFNYKGDSNNDNDEVKEDDENNNNNNNKSKKNKRKN